MDNYYQQHFKVIQHGSLPTPAHLDIARNHNHIPGSMEFSSFLKVEMIEGHSAYNGILGTFMTRMVNQTPAALPSAESICNDAITTNNQESQLMAEDSCQSPLNETQEKRLERMRTYSRTRVLNESPEARDKRLLRMRNSERMRRIFETEEKRAQRLQRLRISERKRRLSESEEARQRRLQRLRDSERARRHRETPEAREKRLVRMRDYSRMRWTRRKSLEKPGEATFKSE